MRLVFSKILADVACAAKGVRLKFSLLRDGVSCSYKMLLPYLWFVVNLVEVFKEMVFVPSLYVISPFWKLKVMASFRLRYNGFRDKIDGLGIVSVCR